MATCPQKGGYTFQEIGRIQEFSNKGTSAEEFTFRSQDKWKSGSRWQVFSLDPLTRNTPLTTFYLLM